MNLNLIASFGMTGYGIAGYHVFKALVERGVDIGLFLTPEPPVPWVDGAALSDAQHNSRFFDSHAPCLRIWHQFDLADRIGRGKFIAYSFFELDPLSPLDLHHLNTTDLVLVASRWAKSVCERSGVTVPVAVAPLGVDGAVFSPAARPPSPSRPCIFLNVGKWEVRKGHEVLVDAFNRTFGDTDRVELWMMPNHYPIPAEEKEKWYGLYKGSRLGQQGKIKIGNPVASHAELAEVMRMATCGVFPSFAEGFNLELLEMMACGKQVITTSYAGHSEFCDATNALLIEGDRLVPAYDGKHFHGQQGNWLSWEDAQSQQLCAHLRSIYERFVAGENLTNAAGIETAQRLSWDHTASRIMENLYAS